MTKKLFSAIHSWLAAVNGHIQCDRTNTKKKQKKQDLKVWNAGYDKANSSHHERDSALIAHKLSRLDIDIAALSEVRLADKGRFQEHGAGLTHFWSGKPSADRRLSGVGFMLRNSIACKLQASPMSHSDCIISMCLPSKSNQHLMLFSVYAITTGRSCGQRQSLIRSAQTFELLIQGEFNA